MKRTPTQEKARRADRKAIERAMLRVLRNAALTTKVSSGISAHWLTDGVVHELPALEMARRES